MAPVPEATTPRATERAELFTRSAANPLVTADDWAYPVTAVSNPGAANIDGQTLLLCRVEDRHGTLSLGVARSVDGATGWRIDPAPLISRDPTHGTSASGVENARVTWVEELGRWIIVYTALGKDGPCVALASTKDFGEVEHIGVAIQPDNKDACLLPRRVAGEFVLFHRPTSPRTGRADIWLSRSVDLQSWSTPQPVLAARTGDAWDSVRVGMGPPPLETPDGWLGIYHGVRQLTGGLIYRAGLVLLDLDAPHRVLRRSHDWILSPVAPYERTGDVPNVVFPTGMIHDTDNDELRVYYGAADTVVAMATARLGDVMEHLLACPTDDAVLGG